MHDISNKICFITKKKNFKQQQGRAANGTFGLPSQAATQFVKYSLITCV